MRDGRRDDTGADGARSLWLSRASRGPGPRLALPPFWRFGRAVRDTVATTQPQTSDAILGAFIIIRIERSDHLLHPEHGLASLIDCVNTVLLQPPPDTLVDPVHHDVQSGNLTTVGCR